MGIETIDLRCAASLDHVATRAPMGIETPFGGVMDIVCDVATRAPMGIEATSSSLIVSSLCCCNSRPYGD